MRRSAFVLLALFFQRGVVAGEGWAHYAGMARVVAVNGSQREHSR